MYHDVLIRIKNAQAVGKERIKVPYSRFDFDILKVLSQYKFIGSISEKGRGIKKMIEISLIGDKANPAVNGLKFFSRPSKKVYRGSQEIKAVKQGFGLGVISTSKGIMNSMKAKKEKLGGEYLFEIW